MRYGSVSRYETRRRGLRLEYGILEDHLGAAAQPAQAAARQTSNVLPVEHDSARGRGREPENRPAERRLARPGFAHETDDLPAAQLEIDVVDGAHGQATPAREAGQVPAAIVEVGAQRLDAHERLARHGRCGRARVRTDGPGGALSDDARRYDTVARDLLAPIPACRVVDVALHTAAAARREIARHVSLAHLLRVRAARVEGAAGRKRRQARHAAGDRCEALAAVAGGRHRGQQRLGVRVTWRAEDLLDGALLDGSARVHHDDPVTQLRDHAEVV